MRVVTSNPLYAEKNRYAFNQPKEIVYEGDIAPLPKWAATGSVALTTGNPNFPIRIIDQSLIISVDGNDVVVEKSKVLPDIRTVTITGSKGDKYIVTITPQGKSCTCSGFSFRRNCRHLNEAI